MPDDESKQQNNSDITDDEIKILEGLRQLSGEQQELIRSLIDQLILERED